MLHFVPREIQNLQIWEVPEHAAGQIANLVAGEAQPRKLVEIVKGAVVKLADLVLAEIEGLEEVEIAQCLGHARQLVATEIELLQVRAVAEGHGIDAGDHVARERQPIEHEETVEELGTDGVQLIVREFQRVQIVERPEGVALDVADRIVPEIEDLEEEQILEHKLADMRQRIVREIEHYQSDEADEGGFIDNVTAETIACQIEHEKLLEPSEDSPRQLAELIELQMYLAQIASAGEQRVWQRVQIVVADIEDAQTR